MATKAKPEAVALPGMEDREITELKNAAIQYAGIRNERMELTQQEAELKQRLLALMHKHKKETYNYNGISIEVVHEEETVKVKVKREDKDEE
jgi:hypothetical protein